MQRSMCSVESCATKAGCPFAVSAEATSEANSGARVASVVTACALTWKFSGAPLAAHPLQRQVGHHGVLRCRSAAAGVVDGGGELCGWSVSQRTNRVTEMLSPS